jgi:O-antigen ligase
MGHPLTLAFNAMLLGLLSLAQGLWLQRQKLPEAKIWLGLWAVMVLIIVLTGSRYPLLSTLILSFGLIFAANRSLWNRSRNWKLFSIASFFLMSTIVFVGDANLRGRIAEILGRGQSFEESFDRLVFWKVNLNLALDYPIGGAGLLGYPGRLLDYYNQAGYTNYERKYVAHNIFIQTFADLGLIGCVGLSALIGGLVVMGWQLMRRTRHPGIFALSLVVLLSGLMQNNLRDSEFLFALWAGIGLTFSWLVEQGMASEPTESRTNFKNHQS